MAATDIPSLRHRMIAGYVEAGLFALERAEEHEAQALRYAEHGDSFGDFVEHVHHVKAAEHWTAALTRCQVAADTLGLMT